MDRATFTELATTASQRVLGSDEGSLVAVDRHPIPCPAQLLL